MEQMESNVLIASLKLSNLNCVTTFELKLKTICAVAKAVK